MITRMQTWKALSLITFIIALDNPTDASAIIVWGIGSLVIWLSYEWGGE